jgi:hypothetical protein
MRSVTAVLSHDASLVNADFFLTLKVSMELSEKEASKHGTMSERTRELYEGRERGPGLQVGSRSGDLPCDAPSWTATTLHQDGAGPCLWCAECPEFDAHYTAFGG